MFRGTGMRGAEHFGFTELFTEETDHVPALPDTQQYSTGEHMPTISNQWLNRKACHMSREIGDSITAGTSPG